MIAFRHTGAVAAALAMAVLCLGLGTTPAQSAATAAQSGDQPVNVELNEGRLLRLSSAANSVFIANDEVADVAVKSPRLVYVFGKKTGETTLYAVDRADRLIASIRIVVEHNLSRLNNALSSLVPNGDVKAVSLDGAIVLTGTVTESVDAENARRLAVRFIDPDKEEVINRIAVLASNQVNLRVRIAEVERSVIKQFGFNWEAAIQTSSFILGVAAGGTDVPILTPPVPGFTVDPGSEHIFGGGRIGNYDINGLVDALAQDNLVAVLAEPTLTAMSGETASFLAGGEFPIPFVDEDDRIVIRFKEFGVSLAFTPTTLSGNRISMRVRPEVSQLSNQGAIQLDGFTIPGIRTRRAETTVELGSGQSFAIAGLLRDNSQESIRGLPILQEVPVLGELFKSDRFQRDETELLIIVTPYLVQPTNQRIPLPTDPYTANPELGGTQGNLAAASRSGPRTVPLGAGSPLAQNPKMRGEFIVE